MINDRQAEAERFLRVAPAHRRRRLGLAVFIFCMVLLAVIFYRGQELGRRSAALTINTTMDRGYKLEVGRAVLMMDVRVGEVGSLKFDEETLNVIASLRIYEEYSQHIPTNAHVTIGTENLIQSAVVIVPNDTFSSAGFRSRIKEDTWLAFRPGKDLIEEAQVRLVNAGEKLERTLENMQQLTGDLRSDTGDYHMFLTKMRQAADALSEGAENLRRGTHDRETVMGKLVTPGPEAVALSRGILSAASAAESADSLFQDMARRAPPLMDKIDSTLTEGREALSQVRGSWLLGGSRERAPASKTGY